MATSKQQAQKMPKDGAVNTGELVGAGTGTRCHEQLTLDDPGWIDMRKYNRDAPHLTSQSIEVLSP